MSFLFLNTLFLFFRSAAWSVKKDAIAGGAHFRAFSTLGAPRQPPNETVLQICIRGERTKKGEREREREEQSQSARLNKSEPRSGPAQMFLGVDAHRARLDKRTGPGSR